MLQMNIYEEFAHWLDDLLENNDMPEETKAFCFNLYEESDEDHIYGAQLIAAGEFDPDDKEGEWACEEVWSCGENIFTVDTSDEEDTGWNHALELFKEMAEEINCLIVAPSHTASDGSFKGVQGRCHWFC